MKALLGFISKIGAFLVIGVLIGSIFFVKLEPHVDLLPEPVLASRDFFYGIAVPDDHTIWMAGSRGKIVRSDDGGKSWALQASGSTGSVQALVAFDAQRAVAVGDGALLIYTRDGGKTWTKSALDESRYKMERGPHKLLKARIDSVGRVWAVGELSTLLVSDDEGASFRPVIGYEDVARNDVAFADKEHGWVVSEFGDVLMTNDGGANWKKLDPAPADRSIIATASCGGNTGIAVGLQGLVLITKDAGASWAETHLEPVTREHFFDVACTEADWTASGDKGVFAAGSFDQPETAKTLHFGEANNFWHTALVRRGSAVYAAGASSGMWRDGHWLSFVN